MSKIKLCEKAKDIKALDKSTDVSRRMKNAFIKSKEKAEEWQQTNQDNPHTYETFDIKTDCLHKEKQEENDESPSDEDELTYKMKVSTLVGGYCV